jgi:glucosamine kinase
VIGSQLMRMVWFNTMGFNPYFHSAEKVFDELMSCEHMVSIASDVSRTFFYGAGSSSEEMCAVIAEGLSKVLINSDIHVGHDLEGAAFSTWSGSPSITCILGTGSNSCYFDGKNVIEEVPSLAYILGDEGSGSWLGKRLLQAFFYKQLPSHIHDDFIREFGVDGSDVNKVNKRVYTEPNPNVYLANFSTFIGKHKDEQMVRQWVLDGFNAFLEVHVECYKNFKSVPVHFIGSVAYHFKNELVEACAERDIQVGNLIKKPIDGLAKYHLDYVLKH